MTSEDRKIIKDFISDRGKVKTHPLPTTAQGWIALLSALAAACGVLVAGVVEGNSIRIKADKVPALEQKVTDLTADNMTLTRRVEVTEIHSKNLDVHRTAAEKKLEALQTIQPIRQDIQILQAQSMNLSEDMNDVQQTLEKISEKLDK